DLLALAFQRTPRREDALGEVLRGVDLGRVELRLCSGAASSGRPRPTERGTALAAEYVARFGDGPARRAGGREGGPALCAEAPTLPILPPTAGTLHVGLSCTPRADRALR